MRWTVSTVGVGSVIPAPPLYGNIHGLVPRTEAAGDGVGMAHVVVCAADVLSAALVARGGRLPADLLVELLLGGTGGVALGHRQDFVDV